MASHLRLLRSIVYYNRKTRRILGRCVPFTLSAVVGTLAILVLLVIFKATQGSDVTVACVMVDAIVGVSFSFTGGMY